MGNQCAGRRRNGILFGIPLALHVLLERGAIASAQETERDSVDSNGNEANGNSCDPSLSDDGDLVAFWIDASNLVTGDTNGAYYVFVARASLSE